MIWACIGIILAGVAVLCIAARAGQFNQPQDPQQPKPFPPAR